MIGGLASRALGRGFQGGGICFLNGPFCCFAGWLRSLDGEFGEVKIRKIRDKMDKKLLPEAHYTI